MHKLDFMTPKERMKAFATGQPMDRYPITFFSGAICARIAGMTQRERRSNAANTAKALIETYRRFGQDGISVSLSGVGVSAILGAKVSDPIDSPPALLEPGLKKLDDVDRLDMSLISYERAPALRNVCDSIDMILDEIGDEVGVTASVSVMALASGIYGTSELMRALLREPEKVHKLLRFTTDVSKKLIDEYIKHGAGVSLADPAASGSLLSRSQYVEFAKPYTTELTEYLHSKKMSVSYHICGKTINILKDMADTGVDTISLDNSVNLQEAKKLVGHRVCLMGNVDPVGIMLLGTPQDVDQNVKKCFRIMYDSPKKYLLSTGCEVPAATPDENIDAFMAAGRHYGKYPYNPELFV